MNSADIIGDWFERYHHDVFSFLVYLTGLTDVDDLVQETFIRAMNHLPQFAYRSSPKTWLLSIARNIAIDEMRRRRRSPVDINADINVLANYVASQHDTEGTVIFREIQEELLKVIWSLPPNYKDVVILRGIMEFSTGETADTLHWSKSRVRVTLFRAMKRLGSEFKTFQREGEFHEFI